MQTLEEIKASELRNLQNGLRIWSEDERGLDNYWVKNYMDQIKNQIAHIDELVQIRIASDAHKLVNLIANKPSLRYDMEELIKTSSSVGFSKDDELVRTLMNNPYPETKRSEFVQAVYASYGFTETLPTLDDVRKLEVQSKNEALSEEERKVAQQELEIARRKLGIGNMSGGSPISFPSEVKQDSPSVGFTM